MDIRDRIIEVSTELFLQNGCKSVTMDDVAKENGISKRTLYEQFSDKSQLLEECIEFMKVQMMDYSMSLEKESENVLDLLFKIHNSQSDLIINLKINFFQELRKYYYDLYKKTVENVMVYHMERINEYIEKGQKEGYIVKNIDNKIVSKVVIEISHLLENSDVFPVKEYKRKELFKEVVIFYFRGIATEMGIKTIDEYLANSN
jgi:AcrR family transcriptional regulator